MPERGCATRMGMGTRLRAGLWEAGFMPRLSFFREECNPIAYALLARPTAVSVSQTNKSIH